MNEYEPEPDDEEEPEPTRKRRRIRRYKAEEVMAKECEQYVMAGKRLPKLHGIWLQNRYVNDRNALYASVQANKWLHSQLQETRETIEKLRARIAELEKAGQP